MSELRIPFAIDEEEKLHLPETAEKGKSYFCPSCQEPVILRKGKIKVAHFAHKLSDACNQETIIHKIAKILVQRAIDQWKSGKGDAPILQRACQVCSVSINQPLPDKVDSAVLEQRLSDGSVVDVALLVEGVVQAAVEIKVTHAVDERKAYRLPIPFIELDGYEVIKAPTVWRPTVDNFKPLTCNKCKSIYLRFRAEAKRVAKAINLELPTSYYRYGLCKCWKCKRKIIVFAWPKKWTHDESAPKVRPIPHTVQYRYSKTVGSKYWVNTCHYCQSIQGDFFLYDEPDGPFFGINIVEDTPMAFERDMLKIAAYAMEIGLL